MPKNTPPSPISLGFVFALASAALFAIRPIFVKLVYAEGVDPTTLITFRMLFSAPIYFCLLLYFLKDKELRSRLNLIIIVKISATGLLGYYAASFFDLLGLQTLSAQLARMIIYTYPTFVVLFGAILFRHVITKNIFIALVVTYLGIAFIFIHDLNVIGDDVIIGSLFIIASAISFSFYLLFSKPLISQVGTRLFTSLALLAASLGVFIHFMVNRSIADIEINNQALLLILIIAIFCTVIPTFFTTAAVARIGADKTGIVATVGPAITSIAAVFILSESFTIYHLIGIAVTIYGVYILQKK